MLLRDIIEKTLPESWAGTRGKTWPEHSRKLWRQFPDYMREMTVHMWRTDAWLEGPVVVNDGYVQDGHHRIVIAVILGWLDRDIPLEEI